MEEKDVTQESSTETEVVNEVPKTDQQDKTQRLNRKHR